MNTQTTTESGLIVEMEMPKKAREVAIVGSTPYDLVAMAVQKGADLATIEKLMDLRDRHEATEARKAFTVAMTAFKAEPLEIFKRKEVAFLDVKYKHAELADVTDVLVPALSRHALSHRWNVKQEGDRIIVDCVLTHVLGHSETVTMEAKADASGKKNQIQAIASAVQYLQRYTFLAATGMATKSEAHPDDDGQGLETETDEALQAWRAVAMEGESALKVHYEANVPTEDWWKKHGPALRKAAKQSDADATGPQA